MTRPPSPSPPQPSFPSQEHLGLELAMGPEPTGRRRGCWVPRDRGALGDGTLSPPSPRARAIPSGLSHPGFPLLPPSSASTLLPCPPWSFGAAELLLGSARWGLPPGELVRCPPRGHLSPGSVGGAVAMPQGKRYLPAPHLFISVRCRQPWGRGRAGIQKRFLRSLRFGVK